MTRSLVLLLLLSLAGWADQERPNVLVFITEDQSLHLGCLGTKGLETPHLDAFAAGGTNFTRAFALAPVCSPSKMALFTGTYPHANSAVRNVPNYGVQFPLPADRDPSDLRLGGVHEDLPTLIELLRASGVHTAVTSKTHVQPIRKFPFHQGFGNPSNPAAAEAIVEQVTMRAGMDEKPFFLWMNIASPHLPFQNLLRANGRWEPKGGLVGDGGAIGADPAEIEVPPCYPDTPAVRQDFADYLANIELIDDIFASMLGTLKGEGVLDNTLVLFTSDHGIGLHRAKQSIYGAGLHIPLLAQVPGGKPGQTITHPVSHLDLTPTVLDYLGIEQPASMIGRSWRPILEGKQPGFAARPTVLATCDRYYTARAVTDGRYYYIRNLRQPKGGSLAKPQAVLNQDQYQPGPPWFNRTYPATVTAKGSIPRTLLRQIVEGDLPDEELYDLATDPWMVENLIADPKLEKTTAKLRKELATWRMASGDRPENLVRRTAVRN